MMSLDILFIIVYFSKLCASFEQDEQLLLVQLVYRHGDRHPIHLYRNDPNSIENFPEGLAQLTSLGKKQHYMLGEALRNRYQNFFTGNPREVKVRSSNVDRCMESAECNMAGMYPPQEDSVWKWNKKLNWQPIPIDTVPVNIDFVLNAESKCPVAEKERAKIWNSSKAKEILFQYKDVAAIVKNVTGYDDPLFLNIIADTVKIEILKGLKIHPLFEPVKNKLVSFQPVLFQLDCSSRILQRARSGLLLYAILQNMELKIANNTNKKVFVYSTHDYIISMLLSALDAFSGEIPPYAATVMFELHKCKNDYTVSFFYVNNVATANETEDIEFTPLEVHGCSSKCTLSAFKDDMKFFIDFDPVKDCSPSNSEETNSFKSLI